jgi:precorrin-2 dehydrogenase/sirohydrochlorin ferrochelatase
MVPAAVAIFIGYCRIKRSVRYAYPVMLSVIDRLAVVVGGGAVAVRKVAGLLDAGAARLRVVAPSFHEQMPSCAAVERVAEEYRPGHLDGAGLVFAATDRAEVNNVVVDDARRRGILVSRADEGTDAANGDFGDFTVPAKLVEGPVVVAVSAGSAALAVTIRDGLKRALDPAWREMAEVMRELRPMIRGAKAMDGERRREALRAVATADAIAVMKNEGAAGVKRWLALKFPELDW